MTRVLLIGAGGRMGRAVQAAAVSSDFVIAAKCNRGDAIERAIGDCEVVIDFSQADATGKNLAACLTSGRPIVIGTTGHSHEQTRAIHEAAEKIPVLLAANFSVGVNTLFWLTRKAAELLGDGFDLEIVETHHRWKKDAPSGTAKRIANILSEVRGVAPEKIPAHSLRAGDVVGDHTVIFAGAGERLELTHKASSRETFALGALRAAQWIADKPAGFYTMEDVLGLSR